MPVRVIAVVEVADQDAVNTYFETTLPLLERAKGRIQEQFEFGEPVVGEQRSEQIYVVEFPDMEAVDLVFRSPEYEGIAEVRDKGFSKYSVSILGA